MPLYQFSADFVTPFIESWSRILAPLRGRPNARMLEIGSFEGRSALWFLRNVLTGPGSGITCVDGFWPPYGEIFDRNIAASEFENRVTKLKGDSRTVLPGLADASFDAIYVDGGHREDDVWGDANESWRLARTGAVIIFDDYRLDLELDPAERPQRGIDRFLSAHAHDCRVLSLDYQVVVRKLSGAGS